MATVHSLDRWLRRIEETQRQAHARRDHFAEAERLVREGDPISRRWTWADPDDGSHLEMTWDPSMGPWEPLMLLIDAAEDVAHGIPRRGRNGEMLTLEMLNRAILERVNRAGTVVALRDERPVPQPIAAPATEAMRRESEQNVGLILNMLGSSRRVGRSRHTR